MKNIKATNILLILVLIFAFAGCAKDSSTTPTPSRDAFIGDWSVSETYTRLNYEVTVFADPASTDGVLIRGFAGTLATDPYAGAVVSGTTITLDSNQVIGDGLKIEGSGIFSGKIITWNYTIDDGANLRHALAIYTKK